MNGCCYGRACSHAVGDPFSQRLARVVHATFRRPGGRARSALPVHPTEIYDSLLNLIFYGSWRGCSGGRNLTARCFAVYLIGYAILRSFVEYFRGDYPVHYLGGWATPAQLVSMGIIAGGILLWFILPRTVEKRG